MTDATLLGFACLISFLTCISGYLIMRRSFFETDRRADSDQERMTQLPMHFSAKQRRSTVLAPVPIKDVSPAARHDTAPSGQRPADRRWLH